MGTQYETFDGAKFTFNDMGSRFSLVQPATDNKDPSADINVEFESNIETIKDENDEYEYINLPKIFFIRHNGTEIILKGTSSELGDRPANVYIDGADYTTKLPYTDDKKHIAVVKLTNIFIGVKISNHFAVVFDGSKSAVFRADSQLKNKVRKFPYFKHLLLDPSFIT